MVNKITDNNKAIVQRGKVGNAIEGGSRTTPEFKRKGLNNLVKNSAGPRAGNNVDANKLNAMIDLKKKNNKNVFVPQNTNITNRGIDNRGFVGVKAGGAVMPYRRAQEGNIALGGMPPPPSADMVSPEMAEEAKSLGIEVAPPGATAEEVADDQLVLLSEGELVVPANVVRYHGLAQYEKMRTAALQGLDEMDKAGQLVSPQETPAPEGLVEPKQDMS